MTQGYFLGTKVTLFIESVWAQPPVDATNNSNTPYFFIGSFSLFELEDANESRQFEYILDIVVDAAHQDLAATSLGTLQDAD